jgi:hypothetical protein
MILSGSTARSRIRRRNLAALFLVAWLNLFLQPCLAELPARPAATEHCDHGSGSEHAALCAAMQATICEITGEWNANSPQSHGPPRAGSLLMLLPLPDTHRTVALTSPDAYPGDAAGPSRHLRFCKLRN